MSAQEPSLEDLSEESKYRKLSGWLGRFGNFCLAMPVLLGCLWAVEAHNWVGLLVFKEQFLATMLGTALFCTFLWMPAHKSLPKDKVPWYDFVLAAAALVCCGYVVINYPNIIHDMASLTPIRIGFGLATIALMFEATRRLIGITLVAIAMFFMLYARFGDVFPGVFAVPTSSWERITVYTFLDTGGLFGTPLNVASTMIVTFVLFGSMLKLVKGDTFITDIALILMGKHRGGPAKVSVGASTLFGMVTGSAVSNVAVVGPISIPMMRRAGYPAHQAAAIEAVSSTGGQIMPPVMGITAFLMADFMGVPYAEVVMAALVPALLYYLAVFIQVDLEAGRRGLKGISADMVPPLMATLARAYAFVVPLAMLIYTVMFAHWTPGRAGLAAAVVAVAIGAMRKSTRPSWAGIWGAIVNTGRTVLDMLVLTGIAGLVIGALQISGIGYSLSSILLALAGDSILLILLIAGAVCVVLGMALPTAAIYVMLAVLVAPALTQLGVEEMAAHLFIFYMGMLSMITPPVCFATFTAAAIARSNFWQTAFSGMRFGVVAYILPFVIPFSMGLILRGPLVDIIFSIGTACIGVFALAAGLVGYIFRSLSMPIRAVLLLGGLAIMPSPFISTLMLASNLTAAAAILMIVAYEFWQASRLRNKQPATEAA